MNDIYMNEIISVVSKWKNRDVVIGDIELEILHLLVDRPFSIYNIMLYFRKKLTDNKKRPMDYKNVYRRTKKILELELIQKVESTKTESVHAAKFYRLSELGLYYLIRNTTRSLVQHAVLTQLLKLLLKNYGDNILLQTVLNPYFEVGTILDLYSAIQLYAIWQYLRACCEEIEKAIERINNIQPGGEEIFIWNEIEPHPSARPFRELKDGRLGRFLKRELKLDWLHRAEIRKSEDDMNLNISSRNNSVLISLNKNKRTAILKMNRKQVRELNVVLLPSNDGSLYVGTINVPDISMEEYAAVFLSDGIKQLASQLVFALVSKGLIENDITALTLDKKFTKLVQSTKDEFNKACKQIVA